MAKYRVCLEYVIDKPPDMCKTMPDDCTCGDCNAALILKVIDRGPDAISAMKEPCLTCDESLPCSADCDVNGSYTCEECGHFDLHATAYCEGCDKVYCGSCDPGCHMEDR